MGRMTEVLSLRGQGNSSVYVRMIESRVNEGGSGIRPFDLGPGMLVNAVLGWAQVSIPGRGTTSKSGPKEGTQVSWPPMEA
ncbi:hypothetical protein BLJ79_09230 [Arthrobacter sp. UCD-GKA]|nr:hypothetical protein BLJ79_09230 [Arthrobacter sp. UCD-GKA]